MNNLTSEDKKEIIKQCYEYAKEEIEKSYEDNSFFHNWDHTLNVYKAVKELGENTQNVTDDQVFLLQIAALFHDLTACSKTEGHENESAVKACAFFKKFDIPKEDQNTIKRLILATQLGHDPIDILEEIIKDADLSHLKNENYLQTSFLNLYKELTKNRDISPMDWVKECIVFFDEKQFYTDYARDNYNKGKEVNRNKLVDLLKQDFNTLKKMENAIVPAKKKKKKKKTSKAKSTKGVETLFRTELRNHLTLSRIADDKANTLISVNSIILSIVLSTLFPKLDKNPYLTSPTMILLVFSIVTIVISILSTLPRTTHGTLNRTDVLNKRGNLVFFGNFHKMDIEDFEWGINELKNDDEFLYNTLTRDLYYLGKVLNKKYTYLRIGYLIFVSGLIISSISFTIALYSNFGAVNL